MPVAHVSLPVTDLSASRDFYLTALKPLNYGLYLEIEGTSLGLAPKYDGPDFWLHRCPKQTDDKEVVKTHVAFKGNSHAQVKAFHEAALKAGATDNGKPGERDYVKGYYAAYVLDPDGHNVECVYYQPYWLSALQIAPSVVGAVLVAGITWWVGKSG